MSRNNYVRRQLKSIGKAIGVRRLDFRMLRRTFSTHFKRHGDPKDLQSVLRHSAAIMSIEVYQQEVPAETLKAGESFGREIMALVTA
jgi:integrase